MYMADATLSTSYPCLCNIFAEIDIFTNFLFAYNTNWWHHGKRRGLTIRLDKNPCLYGRL